MVTSSPQPPEQPRKAPPGPRPRRVGDVMRRPAVTIPATATVAEAALLMRSSNVGLLSVTEAGRVVGVITDRDIVIRELAEAPPGPQRPVGEVMSREIVRCQDSETVEAAAVRMADHQLRRLPVFDAAGALVGILSLDRIAEDYCEHLAGETLGEIVETRGPRRDRGDGEAP